MDSSFNVDASWTVTDDCSVVAGFTVSGYNQDDTTETPVTVSAGASDITAEMTAGSFTACDNYLFYVTATHTGIGQPVTSPLSSTPLVPNLQGWCFSYIFVRHKLYVHLITNNTSLVPNIAYLLTDFVC